MSGYLQDSAKRGDIGRHAREERLVGREARRIARTEFEDVLAEHAGLTAFGDCVKEREEQVGVSWTVPRR